MFSFSFDIQDADDELASATAVAELSQALEATTKDKAPFTEIPLTQLVRSPLANINVFLLNHDEKCS
jgi:hypothetical protein